MSRGMLVGPATGLLFVLFGTASGAAAQEKPPGPVDRSRAPLPAGAVARLESARLRVNRNSNVFQIALSPDGKLLASGDTYEGEVRLWDPVTGEQLPQFNPPMRGAGRLTFSPDGKLLA